MNKVILLGRLTNDADVRYTNGNDGQMAIARCTLAVDRRVARNAEKGGATADFISCVAFSKRAEFLERFGQKGMKFVVEGRIQTGIYTNKDGNKVYTTDVVIENIEFAESKNTAAHGSPADIAGQPSRPAPAMVGDDFMGIPEGVDDEGLPFN